MPRIILILSLLTLFILPFSHASTSDSLNLTSPHAFSFNKNESTNSADQNKTIMFLPLDERFTTRSIFINLATLSPFKILTPDLKLLCSWKTPANLASLDKWIEDNLPKTDILVFSVEMYLYGGLIQSRISNDTAVNLQQRLQKLAQFKTKYPNLKIYLSSVVMRIPAYSLNFEEPLYWANYGLNLYKYSFYQDKYNQLHKAEDYVTAQYWYQSVPKEFSSDFTWRRSRNNNITKEILRLQQESKGSLFEQLYITLDDNAEYGFNIREAEELKQLVKQYQLEDKVHIYPGADEVGLTMLAKVSVDSVQKGAVRFFLVYRNATTQSLIPNYEGQAMNLTLLQQIEGAGGVVVSKIKDASDYDVLLLVNNFNVAPQVEAPNQPPVGSRNFTEFDIFIPFIKEANSKNKTIGFADNRFSNGGDQLLYHWICKISPPGQGSLANFGLITYAGWNTNGNTLGTVISNSVVLALFQNTVKNQWFQLYRFLEDVEYQSELRQRLVSYVTDTGVDSVNNLAVDLQFYEKFSWKVLSSRLNNLVGEYQMTYKLQSVYYPWNRTFEIGMVIA